MSTQIEKAREQTGMDLTATAITELKRLLSLEKGSGLSLRVGVSAGGCSGMSYSMAFEADRTDTDVDFEFDGLKVLVDRRALPYLKGTRIDYKGGMLGGGFVFENPNASRSCGCGSSFSC